MARQVLPVAIDDYLKLEEILPAIKDQTYRLVRSTGEFTVGAAKIYRSVLPLANLINRRSAISEQELHQVLDEQFLTNEQIDMTHTLLGMMQVQRFANGNTSITSTFILTLVDEAIDQTETRKRVADVAGCDSSTSDDCMSNYDSPTDDDDETTARGIKTLGRQSSRYLTFRRATDV